LYTPVDMARRDPSRVDPDTRFGTVPTAPVAELPSGERVYRAIKEAILSGELAANSRLVELALANQFGVSRTPVREALKRLIAEQLVVLDPVRGMVVRGIDPQEIDDAYGLREVLDGLAARLAAQRVSPEDLARMRAIMGLMTEAVTNGQEGMLVELNLRFHELLLGASGNERLGQVSRSLNYLVRLYSSAAFRSQDRDREVLSEHEAIVEALERRDPDQAEQAARRHMLEARTFLAKASITGSLEQR
jgi:DNA-binding GntR family transcriptional regulator